MMEILTHPTLLLILEILGSLLILAGIFFSLVGTFGILRLPDFYTRLHAAGMIETLGTLFILVGLMGYAGFSLVSAKLLLIAVFFYFTSPTASHAIANAAFVAGRLTSAPSREPVKSGEKDADS